MGFIVFKLSSRPGGEKVWVYMHDTCVKLTYNKATQWRGPAQLDPIVATSIREGISWAGSVMGPRLAAWWWDNDTRRPHGNNYLNDIVCTAWAFTLPTTDGRPIRPFDRPSRFSCCQRGGWRDSEAGSGGGDGGTPVNFRHSATAVTRATAVEFLSDCKHPGPMEVRVIDRVSLLSCPHRGYVIQVFSLR